MDTKDLENAIDSAKNVGEPAKEDVAPKMSKEEEIGFHKGSVNTLVAERGELVKNVFIQVSNQSVATRIIEIYVLFYL